MIDRVALTAFDAPHQVILGGAMRGLAIGVFAVGIILIYRSNHVINFALGELGALAAALFVRLTINYHWNFYPAFALITVVGLLLGGLLELALVPRLGKAPKVILMVATIGAAQLFLFIQAVLPDITTYEKFPTAFDKQWEIGDLIIRSEHVIALVVFPVLVGGLTWFLNHTRHGTAVRAAADNPDAARLSGISTKRVSFVVWSLAGGLAAVATILSAPLANANVASTGQLGPGMLLRTLTVAVIAGMASMPIALGAGVVLGVVEAVVFYNHPTDPGLINALLFVTVLVAVLVSSARNRSLGRRERFSFAPRTRPIPESLRGNWVIRHHAFVGAVLALGHRGGRSPDRHVAVAPVPVLADPVDGSDRALVDRSHRLGGSAVTRPVRTRGYRRRDHVRVVPGTPPISDRDAGRRGCRGGRGGGRRSARLAHAWPVPRGHHARTRSGYTVDPRASDLPDRRAVDDGDAAPCHR